MELDIDLSQKTPSDDLPNEPKDKMLAALRDIRRSDVDHRASDTLGGSNNNVVVLGDLESVQSFSWLWFVEDTRINCVGDGVIDEFTKDQSILALIEKLHGISWDRITTSNIWIIFDHLQVA
jgi:hypothetical protein